MGDQKHLYLVDGSGYIFRAYHRLPPLTNIHDEPVGAVYGYTTMLWKLADALHKADGPTHMAVILDASGKSFRNDIYPDYKAHRPPAPEDLVPQFPMIRDATRAFSLPCIEEIGLEADDLIASYTRAALDAVRAARTLPEANLDNRVAVWGHSQGGHTALWTGIRANYAPDLALTGVAAFAPASDLALLVPKVQHNPFGRIVSAYLIEAYAARYADVRDGGYTSAFTRLVTRDIARRCVRGWDTVFSVLQSEVLPRDGIFARDPATGQLGNRLEENSPAGAIAAPIFIAQGKDDDIVLSAVQDAYVRARCIAGQALDYRTYDADHVSLVGAKSPLAGDLMAWTRDRFAGRPAANTCPPPR